MNLLFKDGFEDAWIDQILELHNKTELKRPVEKKDKFLNAYKGRFAVVSCWDRDKFVGFGTLISDGYMYSSIFDVVVDPDYQKQGIGKQIEERLISKVPTTCIHLTSTFGNEEFYIKAGFKRHKTAFAKYPWQSEYLE